MERINFFKKIYYSIIGKKYKEMAEENSWYAILYLAILELSFTVVISIIVARNFLTATFMEIYSYASNFLVDFFDNSLSLTFNTILILSVVGYLYKIIIKDKVKYSKMFSLATYASTLAILIKYVIFILNYQFSISIEYFKYIYFAIVLIYFIVKFKEIFTNKKCENYVKNSKKE
jgi:hypothetical protein